MEPMHILLFIPVEPTPFLLLLYPATILAGLIQGVIVGRAIIDRFPRLQFHARFASISLFLLFLLYGIVNIIKFAYPEKINVSQLFSSTPEQIGSVILQAVGIHADIFGIIALSITVSVLLITKLVGLKGYKKYFVFTVGIVMLLVIIVAKFSNYQPTISDLLLYTLYHMSMTGGLAWSTRKLYSKELRNRNFIEWWTGRSNW